jgi:hypothetical protein
VLTRRQERLILALVGSPTIKRACQRVGIEPRTYRAWKHQPGFAAALAAARGAAFCDGLERVKASAGRACRTLNKCLVAKDAGDRIRASKVLLDVALKSVELLDLVKRVQALEARHAGDAGAAGRSPGAGGIDGDGPADAGGAAG